MLFDFSSIFQNPFNNREPIKDSTVSESSEPTNESLCEDGKVWDVKKHECKLTTFRLAIQWIVLIVIGICILIAIGCFILCCCIL